jgi:hypothetical protein
MALASGLVFGSEATDFSALDRVNALASVYGVEVLGVITHTPWYISACPDGGTDIRCAPGRGRAWRRMVGRIARRATNVRLWELGNEPDNPSAFIGGPGEYARWAALAADAIRAARPDARIALGGLAHPSPTFVTAVLHDPGYPLIDRIDIANVHVRAPLGSLAAAVAEARAVFADAGFAGPLWITETGYPARPSHQWEPGFQGGPPDQARWLVRGLTTLLDAGADAVFVSFRDNDEFGRASPFSSEGVVRWPRLSKDGRVRSKPAFWALRRLARSHRDRAALEGAADELRALAVLRHVRDVEEVEQRVHVALDGLDAQDELAGDLAVGGGDGERALERRPAQRVQDSLLRR